MLARRITQSSVSPIIVGAVCLATQFIYLAEGANDPTFYTPIVDAGDYHKAAIGFAAGERLIEDAFWQPPLFPLLLGCLYGLVGEGILVTKVVLAGIGTASGLLIWWIGRRVFSPGVGFVAGLMLAACGPFVLFNTQLLPTGLAVFLNLAALALWLRCVDQARWYRWLLFGLAVGAAAITVPNSGVLLIMAVGTLLVSGWRQHRRRHALAACSLMILGTAIPIGSVTARNYIVSGEFVVISTNGGINFYIGNNPQSDRTVAIRPGAAWRRLARESFTDTVPTRAEQGDYFLRRGLAYAADEPLGFLTGLGRKAIRLINAREIPRNVDPYVHRDFSLLLSLLMWRAGPLAFPFGLIAPLAMVGIAVSLRTWPRNETRRADRVGLVAYIALYGASIVLFFISGRYRLPVAVVMILFAAAGGDWIWRQLRGGDRQPVHRQDQAPARRRWRYLVAALFVVTAILVNLPIRAPTDRVNFRAELLTAVGEALADRQQPARAEGYLREALIHDPQHAGAACRLANVLGRGGSIEEAEQLLRDALDWDNHSAETREVLGELLRHQGRWAEAGATFREALVIDPTSPKAHAGLADVLAETDRIEEAIEHYRKAVSFTSESGPILLRLAGALVRQQAYKEAIECYRQALWTIEPDPAALNSIAWLLATCPVVELRDCEQAIDLAEHLCRLTEYSQPVALDTLAAAYAECARLDEAVVWVRRAIDTALTRGDQAAAESFRSRLRTYEKRLQARNQREPAGPPAPREP